MLQQERQRIEQLTAGWDDPTQVDWGPEETSEAQPVEDTEVTQPSDTVPLFKCTALYSYTVSLFSFEFNKIIICIFLLLFIFVRATKTSSTVILC